jgi:hypothetical protein
MGERHWLTRLANWTRRDDGAISVLYAPIMVCILVPMMAVTVDVGQHFASRSAQQSAADEAAKAAALAACSGRNATAAATASAQRNGFTVGRHSTWGNVRHVDITNRGNGSYGVTIDVDVDAVFAKIFGVHTSTVTAKAAATCTTSTGVAQIYGHSSTCTDTIQFSGNNLTITGSIHSNRRLRLSGNNIAITGTTTYNTSLQASGSHIAITPAASQTSVRTWPIWFNIDDFDTGGIYASRSDFVHAGSATINRTWLQTRGYLTRGVIAPKIYFTDGQINLSDNNVSGTATFIARQDIQISGNNMTLQPYFMDLGLFSDRSGSCGTNAIQLSGNSVRAGGIYFAPRARISLSGNTLNYSAIVGNEVDITGNSQSVNGVPPQGPPQVTIDE